MTDAPVASSVRELLQQWLPRQRWFAAKGGGEPVLRLAGSLVLTGPQDAAGALGRAGAAGEPEPGAPAETAAGGGAPDPATVEVHLVSADVNGLVATYQVPLSYHRFEVPELSDVLVGVLERPEGRVFAYDATHDPAFVAAWLGLVAKQRELASGNGSSPGSGRSGPAPAHATGVLQPGAPAPAVHRPARVLAGEQSNTSIIVADPNDPDPVILKVFRVLQPGANPDVAVTSALTEAGCPNVPRLTGWIDGEWVDPQGNLARGHLTSVSEYLPGSEDAWRMACVAIQSGRSFAAESAAIGAATAAVHAALAEALPTRASNRQALDELAAHLRDRLDWALAAVPALAPFADQARLAIGRVRELAHAPQQQRIHGDLHLGQVLDAGPRGWVLLDFEGEPLRPLADRNRPDFVHRDIAGMLRSFDYAARHTVLALTAGDPRIEQADLWVADCCRAFLHAYAEASGRDARQELPLLRALELDKALYEAVYESRNRPSWVEIPMSAIRRVLAHPAAA